jgi:predicted DNA-binding ribbon-helix-helix protein
MEEKYTKRIGMRISNDFYDKIKKRAEEEQRTMSNLITKIVADYLHNIEIQKKLK